MNEETLRKRLELLKQERDETVKQANNRLAYLSGQIDLLEGILKEGKEKQNEPA